MNTFDALIFFLYRLFFIPTVLFLLRRTYFLWPFKIKTKIKTMIKEREDLIYPSLPSRPIWIHAASGEIEYAKPVIRELKTLLPQTPILITYFSPSAKKVIQNFPGVDVVLPLPWDTRQNIKRFLSHFQPRAALFARTDVWPETAYQLSKNKIPSVLFAATLACNSRRKGPLSGPLNRWALNHLNQIFCCSSEDKVNFQNLGVHTRIEIYEDTRYDQVIHRLNHPKKLKKELTPLATDLVFVAGSTWPEDEKILIQTLSESYKKNWRWILVPHEISESHLQALETLITKQGLSFTRYTKASFWNSSQVLIVDQIGILPEIYAWGKLAFVGGSFKEKVHSVMEPLAAGLPVLVGPFYKNNREALFFQNFFLTPHFSSVQVIKTPEDLNHLFQELSPQFSSTLFSADSQQDFFKSFQALLKSKVMQLSGSSKKMAKWVETHREKH